jgi:hypothetical protein
MAPGIALTWQDGPDLILMMVVMLLLGYEGYRLEEQYYAT